MDAKKTILVLEDERPLQDAIKLKLTHSGFEVILARTVEEAIHFLENDKNISVVWLDHYLLGKEDGLDFVAKVKANDVWKNIPLFVVSNTAGPDKVQTYIGLGINKYFTKSESRLDEIIADINKFLETKE